MAINRGVESIRIIIETNGYIINIDKKYKTRGINMKKNKIRLFTLALTSTLLISGVSYGNSIKRNVTTTIDEGITMKWNNARFTAREDNGSTVHPIVYNGRTYLPIRFIAEKAGVDVGWDNTTRTVIFNQNNQNSNNTNSNNLELEKKIETLEKENKRLNERSTQLNQEKQKAERDLRAEKIKQEVDIKLEESRIEGDRQRELEIKQQELDRELKRIKTEREKKETLEKLRKLDGNRHEYINGTGQVEYR